MVAGSGRAKLEDEIVDVGLWDVIRVTPHVIRAFEAGPDGLELICVGDRAKRADAERFNDFWPEHG